MSGTGDAFKRLKKAVDDNAEQAQGLVGKAARAAKKATGGAHDDRIDRGAGAATEYLRKRARRDGETGQDGETRGDGENRR
ncbi:Rv0909 family putative TA system antitoxin [Nocardiopsis alborubida]|uniref:Antitoxin protein n=1 Tax=Nocardiopsis alborubida TaxID=146802 RepID=A0A7X6MHT3_9ACTN|nr:Rv0909 family putative TA system antitoxin [Nocardiopsis alborubida]NKZ01587.1 antitoxin protein [Nocardiopsis alborubida]